MSIKLRPYQQECLNTILTKINKGVRLQLVSMATGLGKTTIFAHLPEYVKKSGKKTLILAHREELLEQAKAEILRISPKLRIEIEQGKKEASPEADIIIASEIGRAHV